MLKVFRGCFRPSSAVRHDPEDAHERGERPIRKLLKIELDLNKEEPSAMSTRRKRAQSSPTNKSSPTEALAQQRQPDSRWDIEGTLSHAYSQLCGTQVPTQEKELARNDNVSLCFGEILTEGVTKLLDENHCNAAECRTLVDLGSGLGKLAMQAFLSYPNLSRVIAVEFAPSRAEKGIQALQRLGDLSDRFRIKRTFQGYDIKSALNGDIARLTELPGPRMASDSKQHRPSRNRFMPAAFSAAQDSPRVLEFRHGDLFATTDVFDSDIIICETKVRSSRYPEFRNYLNRFKKGCVLLTYENLENVWADYPSGTSEQSEEYPRIDNPFVRLESNTKNDRLLTSWSNSYGHLFFIARKVA